METVKISEATAKELAWSEAVVRQVEDMGGCYSDDCDNDWIAKVAQSDRGHFVRYEATIDGNNMTILGPKDDANKYFVIVTWRDGQDFLAELGVSSTLSRFEDSLEAAISWAYNATRLAEEAINRHINRGRTEAVIRKLEQEKDDAIDAINQRHADKVAELYQKAGIIIKDDNL